MRTGELSASPLLGSRRPGLVWGTGNGYIGGVVNYPISVDRDPYRGSNPRRLEKQRAYDRDAARLEEVANRMIERDGPGIYLYGFIAREAGMSEDRVREIMFTVAGGHNGFTVGRGADGKLLGDLEQEERRRAEDRKEGAP